MFMFPLKKFARKGLTIASKNNYMLDDPDIF